jgi:FAD/FMN-containing dehydrogenase
MTPVEELFTIDELRGVLDGRVIAPEDPDYDEARTVFPGGFDRRPAAIVRPSDASEVARIVSLARDTGAELAVRNGGHSGAAFGVVDGGLTLDLAELNGLEIDAEARTAWAGGGLTAGEYTNAAGEHGLATGFGDTGSVGVGGITLGGGLGFLSRAHGLTIDNLLAAQIVTADGRILEIDADNYPDLFWAIRGGGGNFGVVTRFKFRLEDVPTAYGGMLFLPATPEVVRGIVGAAEAAPDELSAIVAVMPAPPMPFLPPEQHGQLVVMAQICFAGPPEDGERELEPFRSLATPIVDMVRPISYPEMYPPEQEGFHPTTVIRTMFLDRIDQAAAETIVERISSSDAPMRVTQIRVMGGAIARVPNDATAFAHRDSKIMCNVASFYEGPEDKVRREAWVDEFAGKLRQSDTGAYANFLADEGPERVRAAYPGEAWDRLTAVKAKYDPTNLFHNNQNIPPAS